MKRKEKKRDISHRDRSFLYIFTLVILGFLFLLGFSFFGDGDSITSYTIDGSFWAMDDETISECGVLNVSGATYLLSTGVSSASTCMYIYADNITLDCQGNSISHSMSSAGYGVYSNASNVRIINCNVVQNEGTAVSAYGIYLSNSENSIVDSATVQASVGSVFGIYFESGYNNTLVDSEVTISGANSLAFYIDSYDSNIYSNTFSLLGNNDKAVHITSGATGVSFYQNVLTIGAGGGQGVFLDSASDINISLNNFSGLYDSSSGIIIEILSDSIIDSNNFVISGTPSYAMYVSEASNTLFSNNVIDVSNDAKGVYVESSSGGCTYSYNNVSVGIDSYFGFYVVESSSDSFVGNVVDVDNVGAVGFYLDSGSGSLISQNDINVISSSSYGLLVDSVSLVEIVNNDIDVFGGSSIGLYSNYSGLNFSENEISIVSESFQKAVYLYEVSSSNFLNNQFDLGGTSSSGFVLSQTNENLFSGNSFLVSASTSSAYDFWNFSGSNLINYDTINISTSGSNAYYCRGFFDNNSISGSSVRIDEINSNVFNIQEYVHFSYSDSVSIKPGSSSYDVIISEWVGQGNWNFINSTIDSTSWSESSAGVLNVSWYFDTSISYTNGTAASGVDLTLTNVFSDVVLDTQTDGNGAVGPRLFPDFVQTDGSTITNYGGYELVIGGVYENVSVEVSMDESIVVSQSLGSYYIQLVSPGEGSTFDSGSDIDFIYFVSDSDIDSCSFYLDSGLVNMNSSIVAGNNTFGYTPSDGSHSWYIKCYVSSNDFSSVSSSFSSGFGDTDSGGSSSSGSSSFSVGSGGSNGFCVPKWRCTKWSDCENDMMFRECVNENSGCSRDEPRTSKTCDSSKKNKKSVLFDIGLELLNKRYPVNSTVSAKISLLNIGLPGRVNASLYYEVTAFDGTIVYSESEVVPVETQVEFIRDFNLSNLPEGRYKIFAELYYEGQKEPASTEQIFYIGDYIDYYYYSYIVLIVVVLVVVLYLVYLFVRKLFSRSPEFDTVSEDISLLEVDIKNKDIEGIDRDYKRVKEDYKALDKLHKKKAYSRLMRMLKTYLRK